MRRLHVVFQASRAVELSGTLDTLECLVLAVLVHVGLQSAGAGKFHFAHFTVVRLQG